MHTLAFVVGYVSHFMEQPMVEHLHAIKRILCYVAVTLDYTTRGQLTQRASLASATITSLATLTRARALVEPCSSWVNARSAGS